MALDLSSNAAAKLEPFLLLSKGARGAAAAKLIQDVTSAPGIFVFSELLELPNIQELSRTEQAPYLLLLQLFAHGTFDEYNGSKDSLPSLSQAQLTKLRLLTIISLALERRILPYDMLLRTLQVPTIRELEDLIIDGIYLNLMRGKLDQKEQQFEVEYTIGRDLGPGKVEPLLSSLQDWANTTSSILTTLDSQLAQLASQSAAERAENEEQEQVVQAILAEVSKKRRADPRPDRGADRNRDHDDNAMEVDSPLSGGVEGDLAEAVKGRKLKTPGSDHVKPTSRKRNKY